MRSFQSFLSNLLLGAWAIIPLNVAAQPAAAHQAIAQYVESLQHDEAIRHASMSIVVMEAETKAVVAELHPQTALLPASTLKLVTTGLSLLSPGADYRYRTALCYDGYIETTTLHGNLYVVGGGDPTFGSPEAMAAPLSSVLSDWVAALKDAGICRIEGDMVVDESFFPNEGTPESWTWGDIGHAYGASVTGFSFCENAYRATLAPGRREGDATQLCRTVPAMPGVVFQNEVRTGPPHSGDRTVIYTEGNRHLLTGTIPPKPDSMVIKGANKNPAAAFYASFLPFLTDAGIRFDGSLRVLSVPPTEPARTLLAACYSPTLKEIASVANKKSHNFYAEALLKTIGVSRKHEGSYRRSIEATGDLLDSLGIRPSGLKIVDGSGLSRKNYVSAAFLADFLAALYASPVYPDFVATLATPGDKGTFENLLRHAPGKQRLHAKSGSMEGVRAYAGYAQHPSSTLIFVILINNFNSPVATLQPKVEKLLELMVR
jgi:D-alanyl-D-alanine carboxypeptidase/D-alanyl-D-alanine-endopeptidase (penicillin-binding protein 4)